VGSDRLALASHQKAVAAQTRGDAEAFYSGPWLAGIRERYGMDPQIKYFHKPRDVLRRPFARSG
jgi:hypothetical protein